MHSLGARARAAQSIGERLVTASRLPSRIGASSGTCWRASRSANSCVVRPCEAAAGGASSWKRLSQQQVLCVPWQCDCSLGTQSLSPRVLPPHEDRRHASATHPRASCDTPAGALLRRREVKAGGGAVRWEGGSPRTPRRTGPGFDVFILRLRLRRAAHGAHSGGDRCGR